MNKNWPTVKLGEVLKRSAETIELQPDREYREITVKLWGKGVVLRGVVAGSQIAASRRMVARRGQFILSRIDARNGALGIVPGELDGAIVSNDFPVFNLAIDRVLPSYFGWICKTRTFVEECLRASEGTTNRVRLQEDKFLGREISLPPLLEQHRVVTRIEELAAKIQEARCLRNQIGQDVEALAGTGADRFFQDFSRQPIDRIAEVRGGIQKGPHRTPGANPVRYLTVTHVQRNRILTDNPRFFEVTREELERWRLVSGDVLIIEGNGSAEQIGRTALFRGEIENCVHQNHVIRIRPNRQAVLPEFLNCFLNSPAGQDAVQSQSRTTSGLRTLSVGRIKAIAVPVPPLIDQRRIMSELDRLQAEIDALKQLQSETSAELDAFMPSVLDKAFRGEL